MVFFFCDRRYMAEILPIQRKTLSNQSNNVKIFIQTTKYFFSKFRKQHHVID